MLKKSGVFSFHETEAVSSNILPTKQMYKRLSIVTGSSTWYICFISNFTLFIFRVGLIISMDQVDYLLL